MTTSEIPDIFALPGREIPAGITITHAIIGRENLVAEREALQRDSYAELVGQSWDRHADMAAREVGSDLFAEKLGYRVVRPVGAGEHAWVVAFMAENPSREAFIKKSRAHALDCLGLILGTGDLGELRVLRWCDSEAEAAIGEAHFIGRGFVEVRAVPIPTKAAP